MITLGIDPGTTEAGFCVYDSDKKTILDKGKMVNDKFVYHIGSLRYHHNVDVIIYEMVASYGMSVGQSVFETVLWTGRFVQASAGLECKVERLYRKDVKMQLCHSMRAKDSNIRQAILDRFPATGGGKTPQIGVKKQPGPLFGVSKDVWSALGLCLAYDDMRNF